MEGQGLSRSCTRQGDNDDTCRHADRISSGCSIITAAQELHHLEEWEDFPITAHCLMGDCFYILEVFQERMKRMDAEDIHRNEEEQQQHDQLQALIERVNHQARIVEELQLQGQVPLVGSTGSVPRILSSLVTPQGVYSGPREPTKSTRSPDLLIFSSKLPTPKGEVEIDNYVFHLKLLCSWYSEDTIRNKKRATVCSHAKVAIRTMGMTLFLR